MDGRYCYYYREDGDDMRGLRTTCSSTNRLCYCFPEQVVVDKPCAEVDEEDFMSSNELMKVRCVLPNRTPQQTPQQTPDLTPQQTPEQTPDSTPQLTPYQTPEQTPYQSPFQTPDLTTAQTPNSSVPKTEEPTISFKIIEEQQSQVYIYATIGFFAVLFITVLIVVICCCHKKPEASSEQSISSAEVPVILPTQDFPITITLEDFPTDSDPFQEDFQVSDSYFDALEKDN